MDRDSSTTGSSGTRVTTAAFFSTSGASDTTAASSHGNSSQNVDHFATLPPTVREKFDDISSTISYIHKTCIVLAEEQKYMQKQLKTLQASEPFPDHDSSVQGNSAASTSPGFPNDNADGLVNQERLQEQLDIIASVLKEYKDRLDTYEQRQEELEKTVQRKAYDQTYLKGRVGKLEAEVKTLQTEMDSLTAQPSGKSASHSQSTSDSGGNEGLAKETEDIKARVANLEEQRHKEQKSLADKLHRLQVGKGTDKAALEEELEDVSSDLFKLNGKVAKIQASANNFTAINEAATKEALYAMFHQLSDIMTNGEGDGDPTVWHVGRFEATSDDAFQLRDHVLCRLILFDGYGKALKEARAAKDKFDL